MREYIYFREKNLCVCVCIHLCMCVWKKRNFFLIDMI